MGNPEDQPIERIDITQGIRREHVEDVIETFYSVRVDLLLHELYRCDGPYKQTGCPHP
jgi:hypothetical protein